MGALHSEINRGTLRFQCHGGDSPLTWPDRHITRAAESFEVVVLKLVLKSAGLSLPPTLKLRVIALLFIHNPLDWKMCRVLYGWCLETVVSELHCSFFTTCFQ